MKTTKTFLLLSFLFISRFSISQSVGIGNTSPNARLHITDTGSLGLMIENLNRLDTGVTNSIYFGNAVDSTNPKYTGAIKLIGTAKSFARMSFFTYTATAMSGIKERMTILDGGNVGIGNINPQARLHVTGVDGISLMLENPSDLFPGSTNGILFTNNMANTDPNSYKYTGAIRSIGTGGSTARLGFFTFASADESGLIEGLSISDGGSVGINQINPVYTLDVNGSFHSTSSVVSSDASVGGKITITGNATVNNGLAVLACKDGSRRKVVTGSFSFTVNGLASNALSISANLNLGAYGFTAPPSIYVGNIITKNGDYYKAQVVVEDVTATTGVVRLFNPTSAPISVSGASWEVIIVGTY